MLTKNIQIADIVLGERHRKDFGDVEGLAASIKENGLLQAIGITRGNKLIFGQRRLMAVRDHLGWDTIPCTVLDIDSIVCGEHAENVIRKDFSLSERDAIRREIEASIEGRRGRPSDAKNKSGHLTGLNDEPQTGQETREFSAKKAGFPSEPTARRVRRVVKEGSPEVVKAMDDGKVSIAKAAEIVAGEVKGKTPPWTLAGRKLASTPTMGRIGAAIQDIANRRKGSEVYAHYGISRHTYQRLKLVLERNHAGMNKAIDDGLLEPNTAYRLSKKTDAEIDEAVERARIDAAPKPSNFNPGKTAKERLGGMLDRAYTEWRGFQMNFAINSKALPSKEEQLKQWQRLSANIRESMTAVLDKLDTEIKRCLQKTHARKTS